MSSINRKKFNPLFVLLLAPFMFSCTIRMEIKAFSDLFEENVVWSDQEEKIKIFVHGPYNHLGIAKVTINGEETTLKASFYSDNLNKAIISFTPESGSVGMFRLMFEETKEENSAVFKAAGHIDDYGDSALTEGSLVTLTKRPMTKADLDARNFTGYIWQAKDREFYLLHRSNTPFDGKMVGKYEEDLVEFKFLEGNNYRMSTDKGLLGEGKYSTDFNGMTLTFNVYGSEEFGESLLLDGEWHKSQSSNSVSN